MAHGYAKVAGKPIGVACHGTVGIQHAAMAVYNAWVDRVPMMIVAGNYLDGDERRVLEWIHSAQDCIQPIRDYIKWDDAPSSLQSFDESLGARATRSRRRCRWAACDRRGQHGAGRRRPAPRATARAAAEAARAPPHGDDAALAEAAQLARGRGIAGDRRGSRRARPSWHRTARRACRDAASARRRAAAGA